ncbi:mannosyltransferase [Mucilaginibacter endophyticus]|uniref:mannosyltransferase n=1 Tax=Mucilaginibacter endophyticus TaxID=2675003 RepID=UPI000E0D1520|nr:mannosyltransferase [Mucilaginibacter endophyticus]
MSLNTDLIKGRSCWLLFSVVVVYLFVAYNANGFHNADEHFQIIEFANYKLGVAKAGDLAWEFHSRIRSGLQPMLCVIFFKLMRFLGIDDVYYLSFGLRVLSAILSVIIIRYFVASAKGAVEEKNYNFFIILSYFIWFIPYINVRFSSENWSGMFFLASLARILYGHYQNSVKNLLILGILLGISILFRYQSLLLTMGILLWLYFIAKSKIRNIALIVAAVLMVLVIGFFIDRWLYGIYSFTLYNYFHVNIVDNVASNYGVSPWYEILLYIIRNPGPLGVFIFFSFIILIFFDPKSLLVWSTLPFLVVHMIIPHKELRFLFPIADLVPIVLILGYQKVVVFSRLFKYKWICFALSIALILINIAGLIVVLSKGAGNTRVSVTAYIHTKYAGKKVNLIYTDGSNPYYDWPFPKNTFYHSGEIEMTKIASVWQPGFATHRKPGYANLLVISQNDITGPKTIALLKDLHLIRVYQSIPTFDQKIIGLYNESLNEDNFLLYEFSD